MAAATTSPFGPTRRFWTLLSVALSIVTSFVLASPFSANAAPEPKVQVCHRPPGNPANYQTITIGANALASHLAHGDLPGACDSQCEALCDDGNACTADTGVWNPASKQCACSYAPVNCDDG